MRTAPPFNRTAEEQLVGACIKHTAAIDTVVDIIDPATFYTPAHAVIFSAACRVAMDGNLTTANVVEALRESGELSEIGGERIVSKLVEAACEPEDVLKTAGIVHELHRKRDTIDAARRIAMAAINNEDDGPAFEELIQARDGSRGDDGWTQLDTLVAGVLAGTHRRTEPTVLFREDGSPLLYESRLNWLAGPPESQKSYLAALAAIQEMARGRKAVYIDFEEADGVTIAERMVAIGLGNGYDAEQIADWLCGPKRTDGTRDTNARALFYTNARTLTGKIRTKAIKAIKAGARFVVLDGCAAAMGAADMEEDKAKDVNLWLAGSVWPLVRAGAGVLVIDHVVKNAAQQGQGGFASRGPRGSGAKLAAVSGVTLIAEPKSPGSAFNEGEIELWVTKDRPGRVQCSRRGGRRLAGVLRSTPMQIDGIEATQLRITDPDNIVDSASKEEREAKWRQIAAERISATLEAAGAPMSKTEVKDALKEKAEERGSKGLRSETVVGGFELLIEGGWATMEKEGKEHKLTLVRKYREEYGEAASAEIPEDPF